MATDVVTRQRIIRRPRLTKLLDESPARIKLLVAPAGYGKTTLAQEWLGDPDQSAVWYRCGPNSRDVAALAIGLATSTAKLLTGAGHRMQARLTATGDPDKDVDVLAELFAEDLGGWPAGTWLAIDDYQFAMDSAASERFIELVGSRTPLQMLITSRRRPRWATARRIVYGEIQELDRRDLTLTDAEAAAILKDVARDKPELLRQAQGWPAVIGLAALTPQVSAPDPPVPSALYEFFAEELDQSASPEVRRCLRVLAATPHITTDCVTAVLGASAGSSLLDECILMGALHRRPPGAYELHPLLRAFYMRKLQEETDPPVAEVVCRLVSHYAESEEWDPLLNVAELFSSADALLMLIEGALNPFLRAGRVRTVERWLSLAERIHLQSPLVDLAEAEVALRRGETLKAELLAHSAGESLGAEHPLTATAFIRSGQSAMLTDRHTHALRSFSRAEESARTSDQAREALVGAFFATSELEQDDDVLFDRLQALIERSPVVTARMAGVLLYRASRKGNVRTALNAARQALPLVQREPDPVARASFLNSYLHTAALASSYREALRIGHSLLEECTRFRLTFPVAHAHLGCAVAEAGLRLFSDSRRSLSRASQSAGAEDEYVEMNRVAVHARILCQLGRPADAVVLTSRQEWSRPGNRRLYGEYLASRALALVASGVIDEALETTRAAEEATRFGVEKRVLGAAVAAIATAMTSGDSAESMTGLERAVDETGNLDSLVCAYRTYPEILVGLSKSTVGDSLASLLGEAQDGTIAKRFGVLVPPNLREGLLSNRERDVLNLMAQGLSNKEIAARLFIAPTTVKVHVRHILGKTGTKSRGEAVARVELDQAAAEAE